MFFNFALGYTIRLVQVNQDGLKLNGTHQLLAYADDVNILGGNIYRVSQEECARLREGVPYAKVYRYNPKHLSPKWNGYGDNGQRSLKLLQLLLTY